LNKAIISGNLGADPELRQTNGGMGVCNIRVASNDRRKVDGVWVDAPEWHSIVVFGKTADNCAKFLKKG